MTESQTLQTEHTGERRILVSTTWVLVVLTIPAAVLVFLYGMGAVMSMAGCTGDVCASKGPGEFWFGILFYGAPVVPLVTIAVSIFTSRMRYGIVVPIVGLALLAIDFAVLAITF
ncbi:hypothetical protein BVU76_11455 [Mycolicibacterium porcinum]|nr:hypothetical protein BVU76_11455 [Mycolicibacterium porcinum]